MTTRWLIRAVALPSLALALFGSTRTLGLLLCSDASWSAFVCAVSVLPESTECTPVVLSDDTLLSQQELVNCSFIGGPNYQVMGPDGDLTLHTEQFEGRDGFSVGVDGKLSVCNHDFSSTTRTVGPDGGRLVFPSGAILDVPAGAVGTETALTLEPVACELVDPILASRQHVTHDKRCMAALDIEPADLEFLAPVTLTLPVDFRSAGESPVLVEVFPDEDDYAYRSTNLIHDPEMGRVEVALAGLGVLAITAASDRAAPAPEAGVSIRTYGPCEDERIGVQSEFVELSVKYGDVECSAVFDSVSVTFLDCVGSPTQSHDVGEVVGCPPNTTFSGRVCGPGFSGEQCFTDPQPVTEVQNREMVSLTLWMEAIDPDESYARLFIADINQAAYDWQSLDISLGSFPDPQEGSLEVKECPQPPCQFDVQVLNRYVSSPLPRATVEVHCGMTLFDVTFAVSTSASLAGEYEGVDGSWEATFGASGSMYGGSRVLVGSSNTACGMYESDDVLTFSTSGSYSETFTRQAIEKCPDPGLPDGVWVSTWSLDCYPSASSPPTEWDWFVLWYPETWFDVNTWIPPQCHYSITRVGTETCSGDEIDWEDSGGPVDSVDAFCGAAVGGPPDDETGNSFIFAETIGDIFCLDLLRGWYPWEDPGEWSGTFEEIWTGSAVKVLNPPFSPVPGGQ